MQQKIFIFVMKKLVLILTKGCEYRFQIAHRNNKSYKFKPKLLSILILFTRIMVMVEHNYIHQCYWIPKHFFISRHPPHYNRVIAVCVCVCVCVLTKANIL